MIITRRTEAGAVLENKSHQYSECQSKFFIYPSIADSSGLAR